MSSNTGAVPAQLWFGAPKDLHVHAISYIQKRLCPENGCELCTTCWQVRQQQHHNVMWLVPEKQQYTTKDLEPLFITVAFARDVHDPYFFVVHSTDQLSAACANKLLKTIEEPPPGYHFLLLAEHKERLLPTIVSRCVHWHHPKTTDATEPSALQTTLSIYDPHDPLRFLELLERESLSEVDAVTLVNRVRAHWSLQLQEAVLSNATEKKVACQRVLETLDQALEHPPMPGSSKIFLKNLFLSLQARL